LSEEEKRATVRAASEFRIALYKSFGGIFSGMIKNQTPFSDCYLYRGNLSLKS
jgi:hypothetical protein